MAVSKTTTDYFIKVWEVVRKIPFGKVCTYGLIGEHIGGKSSARMVGWAMNAAHHAHKAVPAHRVVNRNGMLTGKHHFATPTLMEELLTQEGLEILDDQIINFTANLWQPT
jgi:methylated-DNA-protein-cysteine methyltransferase related protein